MAIRKYRVRVGFTYGAHDEHKAGSIVELDESVAKYELDKLELAEVVPTDLDTTSVPEPLSELRPLFTSDEHNSPEPPPPLPVEPTVPEPSPTVPETKTSEPPVAEKKSRSRGSKKSGGD